MRKYDKIYIPVVEGEERKYVYQCNYLLTHTDNDIRATKIDPLMLKETDGPLICMTIEELKEMWIAAMDYELQATRWASDGKTLLQNPDFTTYLQSKGIKI